MLMPLFFLLLSSLSLNALAAEPLRFATTANNPPFEFYNARDEMVGFDIDLAKTLCIRLQRECVITNNSFEMLLPSLKFLRYDAVISSLNITAERKKLVDFTDPYQNSSSLMVVAKGRYDEIEQLKGKRVGVGTATTQQAWLNAVWPGIVAVTYDNYQNALLDMRSSRLDGIFGDTLAVQALLQSHPQLERIGSPVKDSRYFGSGLAIAVRKGNSELKAQLNEALKAMQADGTLETLKARWFGPDDS
ncbi:transporter substrate-binding domain-containing protein [Pantoea sp. FN060301]|uniref:transporter substrate-binding domain-containing protein n=1 Tax=Pantoea sp. FN060301 TaxID=3420380 RepID=UPI003D16CA6B